MTEVFQVKGLFAAEVLPLILCSDVHIQALQKAREGKDLHLVSLGGSVSACHGVEKKADCWLHVILRWLQGKLGPAIYLNESAIPGSTSSLTSQCIGSLIHPNPDIVLVSGFVSQTFGQPTLLQPLLCSK